MEEQMDLFTKSHDREWNRIVFLKVLEDNDAISYMNDRETCKMILILSGNGAIECNNRVLHIVAPALLCINHEDSIIFKESNAFLMRVLFFQPIALNDKFLYDFFDDKSFKKMEGTTIYQDLTLLSSFYGIDYSKRTLIMLDASSVVFKRLMEKIAIELEVQKDGYWPCRSRSYFIELLFFLEGFRHNKRIEELSVVIEKNANNLLHNIIHYLNQNINKKITLELLEKKFSYNRNKINSEFQKEMNTTVMKYIVLMRMQLAGTILRDTEIPMIEVAMRVGYSDVGYFSRTFKLHYGKTPSEYHNAMRP